MNPEKHNDMSGLEKIKALKQEQELKRQEAENQKKQSKEQEELAKSSQYQSESEELAKMTSRREEIFKCLAEIKSRRGDIIKTGHKAVEEARHDEEVEKILHTKEGFDEVFSGEKVEWKDLQEEVNNLNEEIKNLETSIPEKEKQVEELFSQTKEGKEQILKKENEEAEKREHEIADNFLTYKNDILNISEIEKGKFNWNVIKTHNLVKLSPEEQNEAVSAIKSVIHKDIVKQLNQENEKNGINDIGKDIDRIEIFKKERNELVEELRDFRTQAEGFLKKYENLFENHKEASEIIGKYFGNHGERRNVSLAYLYERHKNDGTHDEYLAGLTRSLQEDITMGAKFPKINPIKEYIEKVKNQNEKLISLIENDDLETIKKLYSGNDSSSYQKEFFGADDYSIVKNLKDNYPEEIIKTEASKKTKLSVSQLQEYYKKHLDEQKLKENLIIELSDVGIDIIIERAKADELFGGRANSISDIESKQKTIDANKKFAEGYIDLIKESKERILKDKLNETISFEAKEAGREFSVPKFASDIEKINDYSRNIKSSEENIKNLETSIRTLENKKLGVFESKSKHEQKITKEKEKLAQEKSSKQNNENNRKYVLELQSDDLARIFDSRRRGQNDCDLFKEAGLEKTMTLGDALDKIQVYLDKLLNTKLDDKEIELLNKYTEAKSKFEKANQSILELQKK
ncbi:hypothetical protein IT400_02315 [Candidatus Nomurabacteria bacterium]|nr:hypothetical protein [Candidatus Nomurabacteria bacterium]